MATDSERAWINKPMRDRPRHWIRPKLTPQQRDEIGKRLREGESVTALAAEYGVSSDTIRRHG